MKLIKSLLFTNIFLFAIIQGLQAQPGCPSVEAGNNVTLDCGTNCTNLTASCLATGATTTYTVSSIPYAPPYAYNTGTAILVNIDDTWSSVITLPFAFCFYGVSYTQIIAGSNGVLSFATGDAGTFCEWSYSASCPSPDLIPAGNIFGPYHDIDPAVTGQMYYAILGSYPCRTYVVSWNEIAMFSTECNSMLATHQIVLYESTNVIEVYIQNKPLCTSWNGGNAIVGIQNPDGTLGITAPGRNTSQWTASNEAWRFTPAGSPNYTLTWWQGATQIGTGATVNVCPSSATTYTAQVVYDCCVGNDVTVTDNVTVSLASGGVSLAPANPAICVNGSINLTASGSDTYTWSPATGLNQTTGSTVTASPTTTTTYSVTGISPGCTSTNQITVTVNPNPDVTNMTASICSGGTFTSSPVNGTNGVVPAGTTYSWPAPSVTGITGAAAGSNAADISGTLTNTTNTPINVVYTVTPQVGSCTGNPFTVTVTVNPVPAITNMTATICSGGTFTSSPANGTNGIVPSGTTYSWPAPVATGITGTAAGTNAGTISGTLNNTTDNPINVDYTVTPTSGTCTGAPFTITVTVNPAPAVTAMTTTICSGGTFSATPVNGTNGVVPTGTTYSWPAPVASGITGTASGSNAATISGTLANTTNAPVNVVYTITPQTGTCTGSPFTVTVTVNPAPAITNMTASICSGETFTATPLNGTNGIVPAGTSYTWPAPVVAGITGTAAGTNASNISGTLTNSTSSPINVVYTVTPASGTCTGAAFTVTITVNPQPAVTNMTDTICSQGTFTASPVDITNGVVPTGTTYSWSAPVVAGITGTAAGSNAANISGTLINTTNAPITVVYTVTPTAGTCNGATFTVSVTVNPAPTSDFTISSPNCVGNTATVTYTGTGSSGATYTWGFSGGSAVPGSGQGPHQVTWTSPGSYDITLTVSENNCVSTQTLHTVLVSNISTNNPTTTDVLCNGQSNGTATVYPINGSTPYTYLWSTSPAQTGQTATNVPAGTFYVTITDNLGCIIYDTVQIIQPTALDIDVTYENEGCTNSCDGSVSVNVTGGIQPYQYNWTGAVSNTSEVLNLCTGNYTVTVSDSNNCTITGSATISTNSPINADAYADAQTVFLPTSVQFYFTGSGAVDYLWDFGDGTTSNSPNPSHSYTATGEYTVVLIVSTGAPDFCTDTVQIIITVHEPSKVTIPNVFTPNNDGANETFRVESEGLETEEMLIYNRWGKQIFSWSEVGGEWDGTINGQKAADGIYYYIFSANGYDAKEYRSNGTVTLLR
ncbi:MAG TPA: gliding motility-associated C-terminal domain-containing protein [Bacteroidales bacterium]|nr:gliding motility-associated C-terminal domain-containing protein [Bacteroidales bacterium]